MILDPSRVGPLGSPFVIAQQVVLSGSDLVLIGSAVASILTAVSMAIKMFWDKKQRDRSLSTEDLEARSSARSVAFTELEKTIPGLGGLVDRWQKEAAFNAQRVISLEKEQEEDRTEIRQLRKVVDTLSAELRVAKARILELERASGHD